MLLFVLLTWLTVEGQSIGCFSLWDLPWGYPPEEFKEAQCGVQDQVGTMCYRYRPTLVYYCQDFGNGEYRWSHITGQGKCGLPDGSGLVEDGYVFDQGPGKLCWKCNGDTEEWDKEALCPHRNQCWLAKPDFYTPCQDCGEGFELIGGDIYEQWEGSDWLYEPGSNPPSMGAFNYTSEECRVKCANDPECNGFFPMTLPMPEGQKQCVRTRSGSPGPRWKHITHQFCRRIGAPTAIPTSAPSPTPTTLAPTPTPTMYPTYDWDTVSGFPSPSPSPPPLAEPKSKTGQAGFWVGVLAGTGAGVAILVFLAFYLKGSSALPGSKKSADTETPGETPGAYV